jgi:hypothetical protein
MHEECADIICTPLQFSASLTATHSTATQSNQDQRENQVLQTAGEGPAASAPSIPKSLTRRFEVTILPRLSDKPRKIREVRAGGELGQQFSVLEWRELQWELD